MALPFIAAAMNAIGGGGGVAGGGSVLGAPSSSAGPAETGPVTVGGIQFAPSSSAQWSNVATIALVVVGAVALVRWLR